jgi:MOSC domain-containing protein YiiM
LQCGTVQVGDTWHLKSRPNAWLTLHAVNVCYYQMPVQMPVPKMVERILATPELAEGWKRMFREKLSLESAS